MKKHKVKLVNVHEDVITLNVDGVPCSYFISRPQPLDVKDTNMLRAVMDTQFLGAMTAALYPSSFLSRLFGWFRGLRGAVLCHIIRTDGRCFDELVAPGHTPKMFGQAVADFVEKVGVEVDIDEKTKGVVLLKSDVDKIRKGKTY